MLQLSSNINESLLQSALSAIVKSGCDVYPVQTAKLPFLLQVRSDSELANVCVYLWELTRRSKSQYEIRISGIDRFEQSQLGKTLVLGWWKRVEIFAGFDVRKYLGELSSLPSIQIREDALRKAYVNGFEPCNKSNREVAIAFQPDFFVEYVRSLEPLHNFGQSRKDLAILSEVAENPEINEGSIQIQNSARKTAVVSVSKKLRDVSFRRRVLTAYGFRCAFCGWLGHVEAAHIIPVNHEISTDETKNGLALCTLHHKAYDRALIAVSDDYSVQVNHSQIAELQRLELSDGLAEFSQALRRIIILPPAVSDRPHAEYIRIANRIRGWK